MILATILYSMAAASWCCGEMVDVVGAWCWTEGPGFRLFFVLVGSGVVGWRVWFVRLSATVVPVWRSLLCSLGR